MTPTLLINNVYAGEVPEGATGFEIDNPLSPGDLVYYKGEPCIYNFRKITLPPGSWQLIGTVREMTEDVAKGIVEELPVGNRWYNYNGDRPVWWHTAKESLRSLLASKGLDTNKNWVLVRKV
jgi:hypothetical protein